MQRERRVEIGFGRLHLHGDGDGLDDFGGGIADDVTADHAAGGAVDHQLHEDTSVSARIKRCHLIL